jgi:hypothetical protein
MNSSATDKASPRRRRLVHPAHQRRTASRARIAPQPHTMISGMSTKMKLRRVAPLSTSATTGARTSKVNAGAKRHHREWDGNEVAETFSFVLIDGADCIPMMMPGARGARDGASRMIAGTHPSQKPRRMRHRQVHACRMSQAPATRGKSGMS